MLLTSKIEDVLITVSELYPPGQIEAQKRDIPRMAFNIGLISQRLTSNARIADIGGGVGLFSPTCAALGASTVLVDDFSDLSNIAIAESILHNVHHKFGVEVVSRDVIGQGVDFQPASLDVVTTFDSMEHWHNSPKHLFHQLVTSLKPGGLFVIGVPNCVNLRKRLAVPLGIASWSPMSAWYEPATFRGHVREPSVDDLKYIARDLELAEQSILGRNWLGYANRSPLLRKLTKLIDSPLRLIPSLCSNIYLVAQKRKS